jgi:hypothetical protein
MTNRKMLTLVGNLKRNASKVMIGVEVAVIPESIAHVGGRSHGATVKMSTKKSRIILQGIMAKLGVELGVVGTKLGENWIKAM